MILKKDDLELGRALFHMTATPLAVYLAVNYFGLGIFVYAPPIFMVTLVVALVGEYIRMNYEPAQRFAVRWFGSMMSPEEKASRPKLTSALPMLMGLLLASSFLPTWQFIYVVVTLSIADPMARILGKTYGKLEKLPWSPKKSVVGFLTVWAVGAIVSLVCGLDQSCVLLISLLVAYAESIGSREHWYVDDNFLVPVFAICGFLFV